MCCVNAWALERSTHARHVCCAELKGPSPSLQTHPLLTKSRGLEDLHVMGPNASLSFMVPIDNTTIVSALGATDLIMTCCDFLRACLSGCV